MSPERRASSPLSRLRLYTLQGDMVKPRKFKLRKSPKMELYRRRAPDYTELAYREAVAKLKYLLAESYTPVNLHKPTTSFAPAEKEGVSTESTVYPLEYSRPRYGEVSPFYKRQDEYIDQLEKEGQLYREELSRILDKVREVVDKPHVSDDEDSEKDIKETHRRGRGLDIVYSSRISELEAQLTQCRLELRKTQDEAAYLKAHSKPIQPPVSQQAVQQLEMLQRERDELNDRVTSLQSLVGQLRDKEASATQKVKRSLEVVDQAQFDKNQLEMEVRRLKNELERMSDKQREALQESARRVSEAERRYAMQIERLNGDLAAQWDAANRLNLELDRARRTEAELRREIAQKAGTIEELKKELTTKTGSLQNEALTASAERENMEGELASCRLAVERAERQARQEAARMQAEIQALRARLDRADQDLLHSRKENIRLADVIAGLEKELSLAKLTKDSASSKDSKRSDELTSMIKELDAKHEGTVSELESLIQSQTQLMEKLNAECQALTRRLDESSARHKEEMASLQNNIEYLSSKLEAPEHFQKQEWRDNGKLGTKLTKSVLEEEVQPLGKNSSSDSIYKQGVVEPQEEVSSDKMKKPDRIENTDKLNDSTMEQKTIENQTGKKPTNYEEKTEYSTVQPEIYKPDESYDQRGTTYQQNQEYGQTGEYQQNDGYDPNSTEEFRENQGYEQGSTLDYQQNQGYDQTAQQYQDSQLYEPTSAGEYEQNQTYDQSDNKTYDPSQNYEQPGEFGDGQVYGQEYAQNGANYEQNNMYNQDGSYQQQGYDSQQAYDPSNVEYNQDYDPNVAQYEQDGAYQGGQYEQNEGYTGDGGVYQPEQYATDPTSQTLQDNVVEQDTVAQQKT